MDLRVWVLLMVSALLGAAAGVTAGAQAAARGGAKPAAAQAASHVVAASPASGASAASPAKQGKDGKDAYAGEAVVVERLDSAYQYNADGTGTKLDTDVARMQTEAAVRSLGVLSVPYATGSQRVELVYVRVRKPNGTVVETPATDAQDQPAPVTQAAPFYSDLHLMQIPVRGLGVGDRLEYQVRTVTVQAEAKDQFWGAENFGHGIVILERTVELRVPAGKYVQVSSPKYPATVSEDGGDKVYRWTGGQLDPTPKLQIAREANSANEPTPKEEDKTPPIAWTTFHSWAEVGEWYRGLALDRSTPTPALKAKADEIVYGLGTPEAKIRALYVYVSTQVRYISVSLGVGRYQPHAAAEVLANQYGDCKDKHTLLAALLRAENLPVSTVLIGAGVDLDEAVPAPGWFNHEITLAGGGVGAGAGGGASAGSGNETGSEIGGSLWLDTTPEVAPFRMLHAALRDKLALVIPPTGEPALRRTPAEPPFPVFSRFQATGALSAAGDMKAHVDVTMRGDDELNYREGLRAVTPSQWDRLSEYFARSEGFSGDPSNTVADLPEKTDTPLHIGYDYSKKPYGDWDNFRIIPLQPLLNLPLTDRKTAPLKDIEFGGRFTDTAVSRITLPPGFSADLPGELHVHADFATLDKTYRLEKAGDSQVLVTERTLAIKQDKLPAAQWTAYRKFLDDEGDTEPWVQLTSTSASEAAGHHPPAAGESSPVAADLVRQAVQLVKEKDLAGAAKKLAAAEAVNPHQALLWSEYGFIALVNGKLHEASDDYRTELKQHPEEAYVSRALAGVQVNQGDTPGAVQTLRDALALDNKDEETWLMLSRLQRQNDVGAAEATLRDGLKSLPDRLSLKLALGGLLLQEGKGEEGGRLLAGVATDSQDPTQLNDAAYQLGDTSLNLPVAEAASRRCIHLLNVASARGGNGVASTTALERSRLLIASWDTYGWILYRKGSYSEAEPWLRAAWVDGFGAVPGKHFAMLLEKQGRAAEAGRVQRLAMQGEGGVRPQPVQQLAVSGARPRGKASPMEAKVALQSERTFTVPRPATSVDGWAIFEMDYALNVRPSARFVRGEQGLQPMSDALAKVDTHTAIPPGSMAHLLRRGVLSCHAGPACTLVMMSPTAALAD